MKRGSTIFLRVLIFIMGIAVLASCIVSVYVMVEERLMYLGYVVLLGLIATAVPF